MPPLPPDPPAQAGEGRVGAGLRLAATYARDVGVGIGRVWENVFDWEHLPALHEGTFAEAVLLGSDARGWRVALSRQPGSPERRSVVALDADREAGHYCVRVLEGEGAGSEIWTALTALTPQRTAVEVRFYLPEADPQRLARLGESWRRAYARLWQEDEAMMLRRDRLAGRVVRAFPHALRLGPAAELRARLPLILDGGGCPIRLLALDDGEIVAHATICPHWLGPLDAAMPQQGILRCPWHGYRFDLRTGESADGRGLRLRPAMRVEIDATTGEAALVPADRPPSIAQSLTKKA